MKVRLEEQGVEWAEWVVGKTVFQGTRLKDTQMLHGVGRFVGVGEILEGYWVNGRLSGYGRWVHHDGVVLEGRFINGIFKTYTIS